MTRKIKNVEVRNLAFVDGQNLYLGVCSAKPAWDVDWKRFRVYLAEKYQVDEVYYFIGTYRSGNQDLYKSLQDDGYVLVFREHDGKAVSCKKGNVDTDIVFSIMKKLVEREKFEKIFLVSGDGDYWRTVDYLIQKGKFGKLLVPNMKRLSSLYKRRMSDEYRVSLDQPEIKKKIAYVAKQRKNAGSP